MTLKMAKKITVSKLDYRGAEIYTKEQASWRCTFLKVQAMVKFGTDSLALKGLIIDTIFLAKM